MGLISPLGALEIEEQRHYPGAAQGRELRILSTADIVVFHPLIEAFQERNPQLSIHYVVAGSTDVFGALQDEPARFDLAISSAMDLQMKLANDGFAQAHRSAQARALPPWAHWRDQLYAFTQESVVLILSEAALQGAPKPKTRQDLIQLLREHSERFRGRIGTYDPHRSGAGYLFATQDARQSETFWRLAEVMGGLAPRFFGTSAAMISGLLNGDILIAYNVLGSYAAPRLAAHPDMHLIELEDFTLTLLRTALIPRAAQNPDLGSAFLDFLLSAQGRRIIGERTSLPPLDEEALAAQPHLRPIRLDPGLLVYVDPLKRRKFLNELDAALIRP
ncbi:MAG: ABC transporter substrate-binding protein [Rhizobiales bacterium]|nr:ABC transporter substrate-binding protein [Hyphomicrobiales bacterium]